jgi:hypothetical protein
MLKYNSGKIILKLILEEWDEVVWIEFFRE